MESYCKIIERHWSSLPVAARNLIVSLVVFTMGSAVRGEWLLIWIHFIKSREISSNIEPILTNNSTFPFVAVSHLKLRYFYLNGFAVYWISATTISFAIYLLSGGFLYWYYYICRRQQAEEWKCQPSVFPSKDELWSEILVGSCSLLLGSSITGIIACYVMNGGPSSIYYDLKEYGCIWYILSVLIVFVWQDYLMYWMHRVYHWPFLYRHFHKIHHKFKQPTAFSATAFHPVELLSLQAVLFSPMFVFPVHWTVFIGSLMYNYYHGIIDHSGINFKAAWWQPWQPDTIFHDNHHQYTFVNYGVNCKYWDKIHGTSRKENNSVAEKKTP